MSKKKLRQLTETMFYVLMALRSRDLCALEIAGHIKEKTDGRVSLGPGTLYTILRKFEAENLIEKVNTKSLKHLFTITSAGRSAFNDELKRLQTCVSDAERQGLNVG